MTESNAKVAAPHAGKVDAFPTGRLTYLSPRPLPTGYPPVDHGHAIGKVTGHYLDFGVGHSNAFSWQLVIGGSFVLFLMSAVVGPLLGFILGYHIDGWSGANIVWQKTQEPGFWVGIGGALLVFSISMLPVRNTFQQAEKIYPTRFHRQRREVCFVPEGEEDPIFVPWEQLQAWILESQGVSEYGVRRQYGFGVGFHHLETGERFTLEFETHGRPLAISNWEALRAYMEYDVHSLEEIQPRAEGMDSEEAPMEEGVAYFHYARRNLRRRRQAGEVGWIHTFFWYLYHLMTFWTVPNRLVEWENRKLAHLVNRRLPPAMAEWSKPLPESDWARPSEELVRLSERVRTILKAHPERDITEVHASVYEQSGDAEALRA